ncbi:hypothetical protein L0B53_01865 [Vibrio sp. SS-MA-C1-2]|uniref:hypothetical protein n=1 Tax=Vibrio sp. SS-MA-C1-2 TaxID=2908646 RepID=UPI001F162CBE|nr:hypothetical protein [Vibrio sp. SS-MA-C1-2]UJF17541.1 hypothetical protein L0B53_01865 [Vibrio sp. SS-MA-C1-2]
MIELYVANPWAVIIFGCLAGIGGASFLVAGLINLASAANEKKWGWFIAILFSFTILSLVYCYQRGKTHYWLLKMQLLGLLTGFPMAIFVYLALTGR